MRPSLQAVLPFGVALELGNSADAYCAVAHAQSLRQVKSQDPQVKGHNQFKLLTCEEFLVHD
jgi:hypothetical protein